MSLTATGHWIGTVVCVCFFFLGTADAACSSTCLANTVDSTAPVCNETTGECLYGCKAGYAGFQCQIPCGENCLNCSVRSDSSGDDTVCNQCALNHFNNGSRCELCSDKCQPNVSLNAFLCNEIDGYCTFGCKKGYFGLQCDKKCNDNCLENTTSDLPICNSQNGTCTFGCKGDLTYGPICEKSCGHLCVNSVCDRDGTCRGCRIQFFGQRCTEVCSQGCSGSEEPSCHQNGTCKEGCIRSFWGPNCIECSKSCMGNTSHSDLPICDQHNGTCTFGCKYDNDYGPKCDKRCSNLCVNSVCDMDGTCRNCRFDFSGPRCNEICSAGCVDNESPRCYQNGTCKEGCVTNFWGPTCVDCNENCVGDKTTGEYICRESDGFCLQGCKAGKYGLTCSDDCLENCKNNVCHHESGQCVEKCSKGFYGEDCRKRCSPNCLDQGDVCFHENGTCIAEKCAVSWFGPRCEQKCPVNCMNNICDRNTGFCSDGCAIGYFGNTCEAALEVAAEDAPSLKDILGPVLYTCASLVLVGLTLILLCIKRKRVIICYREKVQCCNPETKDVPTQIYVNSVTSAESERPVLGHNSNIPVSEIAYEQVQERSMNADHSCEELKSSRVEPAKGPIYELPLEETPFELLQEMNVNAGTSCGQMTSGTSMKAHFHTNEETATGGMFYEELQRQNMTDNHLYGDATESTVEMQTDVEAIKSMENAGVYQIQTGTTDHVYGELEDTGGGQMDRTTNASETKSCMKAEANQDKSYENLKVRQ